MLKRQPTRDETAVLVKLADELWEMKQIDRVHAIWKMEDDDPTTYELVKSMLSERYNQSGKASSYKP